MHYPTRFSCVGCGACCKGRFIPLTLGETKQWLERGDDVAVLLEAFSRPYWAASEQEYQHSLQRSAQVSCGATQVHVTAIFAAHALTQCPNLQRDDLCGIYENRPLVCRIYPMEINPFIELEPLAKDCPPEAWEPNTIIISDASADPTLSSLIQASRRADRNDARLKLSICNQMGINVAAWKAEAFVIHFPARDQFLQAVNDQASSFQDDQSDLGGWTLRVAGADLSNELKNGKLALDETENPSYIFHALR
ncbi:YkgJ family cysteine cluster protein [Pseudomonas sp. CFBP 13711]|uniref:YkgJ family cysteine cluster protein n=1 Tax=unclassified Pseudomonas TaxID=196821 RepID=UPI00177BA051|nr:MULTISPECIES: YkgJ family cysteine cluster protein [unclassified Pseudomonas]MBD8707172.1 YkgJ family cysteine cluster protein [Pseudomonas sp. CFBP 13711]MBD8714794.1 YkgJ family cysteine cluster protein [Pseudomonas sp. CFBP 13715]